MSKIYVLRLTFDNGMEWDRCEGSDYGTELEEIFSTLEIAKRELGRVFDEFKKQAWSKKVKIKNVEEETNEDGTKDISWYCDGYKYYLYIEERILKEQLDIENHSFWNLGYLEDKEEYEEYEED